MILAALFLTILTAQTVEEKYDFLLKQFRLQTTVVTNLEAEKIAQSNLHTIQIKKIHDEYKLKELEKKIKANRINTFKMIALIGCFVAGVFTGAKITK